MVSSMHFLSTCFDSEMIDRFFTIVFNFKFFTIHHDIRLMHVLSAAHRQESSCPPNTDRDRGVMWARTVRVKLLLAHKVILIAIDTLQIRALVDM